MKISVIIPVYNNAEQLEKCLSALQKSSDGKTEIIVVDDFSTDDSVKIAEKFNAEVYRLEKNSGPAAARNRGAEKASGDILFFVDSDVVAENDSIDKIRRVFAANESIAAAFGSYDDQPAEKNFLSQYRNLLHHYFHQENDRQAETFWAGCGAISRSVFLSVGGFNAKHFSRPQIEDIELGYRLRENGHRILIVKDLQVKHLKKWTFGEMLKTDIFDRALPWTRLLLENPQRVRDLNINNSQKISAVLTWILLISLFASFFYPLLLAITFLSFAVLLIINRRLFGFFLRKKGFVFTFQAVFFQILYYLYSSSAYAFARAAYLFSGRQISDVETPETS